MYTAHVLALKSSAIKTILKLGFTWCISNMTTEYLYCFKNTEDRDPKKGIGVSGHVLGKVPASMI